MRLIVNLLFSMAVMLFLITFFSPDEAATIFVQSVFFFICLMEIIINALITSVMTIIFVFQSFLDMLVFFADLNPESVLLHQRTALAGSLGFFQGLKDFLEVITVNFETLLGIEINFDSYQSPNEIGEIIGVSVSIALIIPAKELFDALINQVNNIIADLQAIAEERALAIIAVAQGSADHIIGFAQERANALVVVAQESADFLILSGQAIYDEYLAQAVVDGQILFDNIVATAQGFAEERANAIIVVAQQTADAIILEGQKVVDSIVAEARALLTLIENKITVIQRDLEGVGYWKTEYPLGVAWTHWVWTTLPNVPQAAFRIGELVVELIAELANFK